MNMLNKTIGEIVADDYRNSKVFEKYGIDFCCGGKVLLSEVCEDEGLDLPTITKELEEVTNKRLERDQNYASWELPFLIDFIVNVHHGYLNENTEQIKKHTQKIAAVHGERHPELIEISSIFEKIASDMSIHLKDEEAVFFPALKRADMKKKTDSAVSPEELELISRSLENLVRDHEEIGKAVHKINHLTSRYITPEDVCNTYILTYKELKEFEDDLHKHVHLENNILFLEAEKIV
jgi:regulator of cell morphogenesis and NO signaling